MSCRTFVLFALLLAAATSHAFAAEPQPRGRVLFFGIDGCRFDTVEAAKTPNLHTLMAQGCYSDRTLIFDRYRNADTVSGPGWSSLLTGVWADKHGVIDNKFTVPNYHLYPHFFRRVKETFPQARTMSIADWEPISKDIVTHADVNECPDYGELYLSGDRETTARAVELLERTDPTVLFVYYGQVDEHGHKFGFSSLVPQYVGALERVDKQIGEVVAALHARPKYAEENWLVLVSSDHGGKGKDHGRGHTEPEIFNSFLIVSGPAAERGKFEGPTYIVDVPVTALVHLGVPLDPKWQLDGRALGLKK